MTWTIDKQFSFCYGHRVWVQKLEHEFCAKGDTKTKCRHVHGHEGLVHVFLNADTLNDQGMCTDFKHLGWLKNFLDDNIDHKFIADINDPLFSIMLNGYLTERAKGDCNNVDQFPFMFASVERYMLVETVKVPGTDLVAGMRFDTTKMDDGPLKEFYDGYFLIDFIPTSENLAKWLFNVVDAKMSQLGVKTSRIDWFETPKSRASYVG